MIPDPTERLDHMRYAGLVNKKAIKLGFRVAKPGVSLREIDEAIESCIRALACVPAFKNYQPEGAPSPYPATACISPNEVAVHGLPGDYILKDGDLLTIDVGTERHGWFVDAARSRVIGENIKAQKLIDATEAILDAQLAIVKNDCDFLSMIRAAEAAATEWGVNIMAQWGGHGISSKVHLPPFIPSAINRSQSKIKQWGEEKQYARQYLTEGQTVCIEPVVTYGNGKVYVGDDGWTVYTEDGSLAAHTERTILVLKDGYEILS